MHTSPSHEYIMEDAREAHRLADKVDAPSWVRTYLAPLCGAGARILDVGCGPGTVAAGLASSFTTSSVVGIDQSSRRLLVAKDAALALPNVDFVGGDAMALPFPSNTFDVVYARFLLEYLMQPQTAVNEMARVCRPGGAILLQDLDGQTILHYPPDPELDTQINNALAGLAQTRFDPLVGRKLFYFASAARLTVEKTDIETYHLIAGRVAEREREQWELKLDIALPALTRTLGSRSAAVGFKKQFLEYLDRDDTLSWSQIFTVIARK